jgi:hypothetical protein
MMLSDSEAFRYWAFISYSHADAKWALWPDSNWPEQQLGITSRQTLVGNTSATAICAVVLGWIAAFGARDAANIGNKRGVVWQFYRVGGAIRSYSLL